MTVRAPVLLLAVAACAAPAPNAPLSVATGGLVAPLPAPTAPAGVASWPRPEWRVGDRFVLARSERTRFPLEVRAIEPSHYELTAGGAVLRRDRDLGNLGEWSPAGEPLHLLLPVDARFHWPLWVGKRWACEFVDRAAGQDVAVRADYAVEDLDTITVPAGTFETLRIVRTVRRLGDGGDWQPRTQITWYAPAVGHEVRQLVGEALVELVEHTRGEAR
jgi:hypothetical protein